MKELTHAEIATVSGAGKIQDSLSSFFGSLFNQATTNLNSTLQTGYDVTEAQTIGQDFGSKLGLAIENIFSTFIGNLNDAVIGSDTNA